MYKGPERRSVPDVSQQIKSIRDDITELNNSISELLEIWHASKGFIAVLGWIGKGIKWVIGLGLIIAGGWAVFKS